MPKLPFKVLRQRKDPFYFFSEEYKSSLKLCKHCGTLMEAFGDPTCLARGKNGWVTEGAHSYTLNCEAK